MAGNDVFAMTNAILRAAGIDPSECVSVQYQHEVGGIPRLTVGLHVWNPDTKEFDTLNQVWELAKEE